MYALLGAVVIDPQDCPVELTADVETHLKKAVEAQLMMVGPLAFLTHWTVASDLIIMITRVLRWLEDNAPIDFETLKIQRGRGAYEYAMSDLAGEQDSNWASVIGLLVARNMKILEAKLDGPFKLLHEPFSDELSDDGGFEVSYDRVNTGRFVQAVLVNSWLAYHDTEHMRSFVAPWQIEQAKWFIESVLQTLAQDHPVLGTRQDGPSCFRATPAQLLWEENLRHATAAYDASRKVV